MDLKATLAVIFCLIVWTCNSQSNTDKSVSEDNRTIVEMNTTFGTIVLELYNETPLHRDNFIKLVNDKAYDNLMFHRVIENFMIQGGDPDSRFAKPQDLLGEGDLDYTVAAEFKPDLFHKKGALSTAREETLGRVSSAMQFFIVQGKVFNDSLLNNAEYRINNMLARHYFLNQPSSKALWKALKKAEDNEEQYEILNDSINKMVETFKDFESYTIPEAHRQVYKTIGGTPHLDQNYTVFGQVVEGLNVIDSIAKVKTDENDRPLSDVRILSIKLKSN